MEHPQNVDDVSGGRGFQWRFHGDLCNSGYDASFISSKSGACSRRLGFLTGALSIVGGMTVELTGNASGGLYGSSQAVGSASQLRGVSAVWHKEHDGGFATLRDLTLGYDGPGSRAAAMTGAPRDPFSRLSPGAQAMRRTPLPPDRAPAPPPPVVQPGLWRRSPARLAGRRIRPQWSSAGAAKGRSL